MVSLPRLVKQGLSSPLWLSTSSVRILGHRLCCGVSFPPFLFLSCVLLTNRDLRLVFFAVCILGAVFSLLLPEVKGRDPDLVYAQEIREDRIRKREMEQAKAKQ